MLKKQFAVALTLATLAGLALAGEKEEAQKNVADAVAAVHKDKAAAVAEMNNSKGRFVKGEIYAFAYDLTGTMVAHPMNPKLVGKNVIDVPDAAGKLYRKDIIDGIKATGSATVEYRYKNPKDGKVEDKITFCKKAGDLAVCSGYYK